MIDLTFVRMANMHAREIKAKEYSRMLRKKRIKVVEYLLCVLTGMFIAAFLILISYI